jgi:HpaII restriction endonuclease.
MYLKGDKQDWSKIYAMFRLLVDNGMAMGTIDLVAKKDSFKQLIKITRDILNGQLIIIRDNESVIVQTIAKPKTDIGPQEDIYLPEEKTISIPISEIERLSILLLDNASRKR